MIDLLILEVAEVATSKAMIDQHSEEVEAEEAAPQAILWETDQPMEEEVIWEVNSMTDLSVAEMVHQVIDHSEVEV
jgi:hypothetical protein